MKMYRVWVVFAVMVTASTAVEAAAQKDEEILEQFFKMSFLDEEYGYVLEGIKPISARDFMPLEKIPPYKDLSYAKQQFKNALLVAKAIAAWERVCAEQRNFVLKAVPLMGSSAGWEVLFINIAKLREAIEENVALFRYVLGPMVGTEPLVQRIAYSKEPLYSILQNDLTLVGIVLGFETHNSIIGGRSETIAHATISKDCPPFLPKSQLMFSKKEHSLNAFSPQCFGLYYLAYAGGDDSMFEETVQTLQPSCGFSSLEDEVMAIEAMHDSYPAELRNKPAFIFNAFKGSSSNKQFFNRLIQAQRKTRALLKRKDFLKRVLKKVGAKEVSGKKKASFKETFGTQEWVQVLEKVADQFEDPEKKRAFFKAYCQPTEACRVPPKIVGASQAIWIGLKKALLNLRTADAFFKNGSWLYFKTAQKGEGKEVRGAGAVRVNCVIEDLEGSTLFANCDLWLPLAQAISGIAHGVQGMRVGEKRILYIHPNYGYGALTTLPPCSGLIVKIHLLDFKAQEGEPLAPLSPLDTSWIEDPALLADLQASLEQQPLYLGFLYRELLDEVEEIDQSEILERLAIKFNVIPTERR